MTDDLRWVRAVRASHDRLTALLDPLSADEVERPSYDDGWSIAAVASHLGSQSEIFGLFLDAGRDGTPVPEIDAFREIWARWDSTQPAQQVRDSIAGNAALVARIESLTDAERDSFRVSMFGRDAGFSEFAGMRLNEHAIHTWDVAVALDNTALVAPDAVELLMEGLPDRVAFAGKAVDGAGPVLIRTTDPAQAYELQLSPDVTLTPVAAASEVDGVLALPAEALLRLVAGRLDPDHTPTEVVGDERLDTVRQAFPGF